MDPLLYNGIIYKSAYPQNVKGNQYFLGRDFLKGTATIRGVKYSDLALNYDTYKQELLLSCSSPSSITNIIMISKVWLEDFSIGDFRFRFYASPQTPNRIYQVLGSGSILLLYYWKKDLILDNASGSSNLCFVPKREQNVLIDNSLKKFHSNRSFIRLFDKEKQIPIKKYLRQNKLKLKKGSDQEMEGFINFCSNL